MGTLNRIAKWIVLGCLLVIIILIGVVTIANWFTSEQEKKFEEAISIDNLSFCDSIEKETGRLSKEHCYVEFAFKRADVSLCDKVGYSNNYIDRDYCFSLIASANKDGKFCEMVIKENAWGLDMSKDSCYEELAAFTGNSSWCDFMASGRESCIAGSYTVKKLMQI